MISSSSYILDSVPLGLEISDVVVDVVPFLPEGVQLSVEVWSADLNIES